MLNLRRLFDRNRVEYRTHGPNTSKGNINICCPFCCKSSSPDYGFHLGLLESTGQWHCFRNPKHSGRNPTIIFKMLRIPEDQYKDQKFAESAEVYVPDDRDYSEFSYFEPAQHSQECLDYLSSRKFTDPETVCTRFNLKYSPLGKWAGRLIVPLTVGWTGRSMRPHIEPRYKAHTSESGFFAFSQGSTSVIIIEGSIDGMKIATVSSRYDVVGRCGNRISPALLMYLRTKRYFSIYNSPDGDITPQAYLDDMRLLRSYCTWADYIRSTMPEFVKDYGEMEENEARRWLHGALVG